MLIAFTGLAYGLVRISGLVPALATFGAAGTLEVKYVIRNQVVFIRHVI
jgi:hypothetical protein